MTWGPTTRLTLALLFSFAVIWPFAQPFGRQEAVPVEFTAARFGHLWVLPVSVDGGPVLRLVVDSGANRSIIQVDGVARPTFETHTLTLGSISMPEVELCYDDVAAIRNFERNRRQSEPSKQPIRGIIGNDILKHFRVGFDYARSEVTLWQERAQPDLSAWVLKGEHRAGQSVKIIDLNRFNTEWLSMPAHVAGRDVAFLLDTGMEENLLASDSAPADSEQIRTDTCVIGKETLRQDSDLTARIALPSDSCSWFFFIRSGRPIELLGRSVGGIISLSGLRSKRLVVDFIGKRLYREPLTNDDVLSLFLSDAYRCPLRIDGNNLMIAPKWVTGNDWMSDYEGAQLLAIGDLDARAIVRALRTADSTSVAIIAKLLRSMAKDVILDVITSKGRLQVALPPH